MRQVEAKNIHGRGGVWQRMWTTALAVCLASAALPSSRALAAPAVSAEEKARADELSEQAVAKFEAKEFDEAVDLFQQAYDADPQPNYLFNIGRVYEEKGDLAKAVEFYERFVQQPSVELESRQFATERLQVLRATLAALAKEERQETEERTAPVTETDTGPKPDDRAAKRKKQLRIAGYSLLGIGGAALIGGGIAGGIALRTSNRAEDAEFVDDTEDLRQQAKRQARAADVLFIAGGVVAAVGLVLVLVTLNKRGASSRTAFARRNALSVRGLGLTYRF